MKKALKEMKSYLCAPLQKLAPGLGCYVSSKETHVIGQDGAKYGAGGEI